jgi:GT2 family glycosyltransferase
VLTSIIIVNHNTPGVLKDCVESVFRFENSDSFEIIIVDNASNDSSNKMIDELDKKYSNVSSIYLSELKSFSFANNSGIENAKGNFILIMNPDIIFTESLFDKLIELANNNSGYGALSPALTGMDGNFQRGYFQRYPTIRQFIYYYSFAAGLFNRSARRMNKYLENQDIDITTRKIYYTEQIPCAFFFTTKETISDIGLMDEHFVLFFEDVDLSYRINKSHKLAVDTSIKVTHLGGTSFKTENNWWLHGRFIRSMVYFFEKHYSPLRAFTLKLLVKINSYLVLFFEKLKVLFNKSDEYRINKHRYLLKLLREEE